MATIVTVATKGSPLTPTQMDANFTNLNTDKLEDASSDGNQYVRRSGAWTTFSVDNLVETSSTKPSSPADGQPWFSESNGVTYIYNASSGDWSAMGSTSGQSGVTQFSLMSDVSLSSVALGEQLTYESSSTSWQNSSKNDVVTSGSFGTSTLTAGVWLVDVRMSIGEGTASGGVPQATIYIETNAGSGWSYQTPYGLNGYAAIESNPNVSPREGAWVRLISVSSSYLIKTSKYEIYRTGDIGVSLTAVKVGDV